MTSASRSRALPWLLVIDIPFYRTLDSLALFLNSSDVGEIEFFRVPNTHTILHIALQDTVIAKSNLARTILRTQQSLSTFIRDHDAEDEPLVRTAHYSTHLQKVTEKP